MNFLQKIIDTEHESEQILREAQEEASRIVAAQKKTSNEKVAEAKNELASINAQKISAQKKQLIEAYKNIVKKGQKEAEEIQTAAGQHREKATSFVLENI